MKSISLVFLVVAMLSADAASKNKRHREVESSKPALLEIHLADLGYKPVQDYQYPGTGIPSDLTVLYDDYQKRLTFIDQDTLVIYQSHYQRQNQNDGLLESRYMEAFFVNPQTGALIARKTWPTIKRRWFNERWDTQARILAVSGGFLVHAGHALTLYSSSLEERATLKLEIGPPWAVSVPPLGRTIHLQRIDGDQADGEWLASDSFEKLRSQQEVAGIASASDHAVVDELEHCVQLQTVGESPQYLSCMYPQWPGMPLFLNESEFLIESTRQFTVRSTKGERLWGREGSEMTGGIRRSLSGNRFVIFAYGSNRLFDEVKIPKNKNVFIVYDRDKRLKVFELTAGRFGVMDFTLSPDGTVLAILLDDVVRLYKTPDL